MDDLGCVREQRSRRVPDTEENLAQCACPQCPTYDQCMLGNKERLYCSRGKTPCHLARRGCVCGECPVATRFALSANYYCGEGVAKF